MSHVQRMDESWYTHKRVMAQSSGYDCDCGCRRGVTHCDTLQHAATHGSTLQHTATRCNTPVTWLNHTCHETSQTQSQPNHKCANDFVWLINKSLKHGMSRSDVWHDSFRCVSWLIQICVMTHSCTWLCPFESVMIQVTQLIVWHIAPYCNTLRHTWTYCDTLKSTANTLQLRPDIATHGSTRQHAAPRCTTLQHTANCF